MYTFLKVFTLAVTYFENLTLGNKTEQKKKIGRVLDVKMIYTNLPGRDNDQQEHVEEHAITQ